MKALLQYYESIALASQKQRHVAQNGLVEGPWGHFCEESWASRSDFEKKWPYSCVIQEF